MPLTGSFDSKVGVITVTIDATNSYLFEILDFGEIKYDFDISPEDTDIKGVSIIYQALDITTVASFKNGLNIYDYLVDDLGGGNTSLLVEIDTWEQEHWEFKFQISEKDLELDEITNKLKIECNPVQPTEVMQDLFNTSRQFLAKVYRTGDSDPFLDAWSVGGFLDHFLSNINPNLSNVIAGSPGAPGTTDPLFKNYVSADINDTIALGTELAWIVDYGSYVLPKIDGVDVDQLPQISIARALAGIEGSLFGTGFDRNFYVWRKDSGNTVTIPYQNCLDLKFDTSYAVIQTITNTLSSKEVDPELATGWATSVWTETISEILNPRGAKKVDLFFYPAYPFYNTGEATDSGGIGIVENPEAVPYDQASQVFGQKLMSNAVESYKISFPAQNTLRIKGKFRGFLVKPWQTFQFDSSAPARYQGKKFRLSHCEYNVEMREMGYGAYQVS